MSNKVKSPLMKKAPTYSLRASIISILIGLLTGAVVILIVGAFNPLISLKGAWDGIRLVLSTQNAVPGYAAHPYRCFGGGGL